jgi:hypothetical protein
VNYISIYNKLIQRALDRDRPNCYVERHHIIPISLGGVDHYSNIAVLTVREHKIAHILLAKLWPNQWHSVECFFTDDNPNRAHLKMTKWIRRNIHMNRQRNIRKMRMEEAKVQAEWRSRYQI